MTSESALFGHLSGGKPDLTDASKEAVHFMVVQQLAGAQLNTPQHQSNGATSHHH